MNTVLSWVSQGLGWWDNLSAEWQVVINVLAFLVVWFVTIRIIAANLRKQLSSHHSEIESVFAGYAGSNNSDPSDDDEEDKSADDAIGKIDDDMRNHQEFFEAHPEALARVRTARFQTHLGAALHELFEEEDLKDGDIIPSIRVGTTPDDSPENTLESLKKGDFSKPASLELLVKIAAAAGRDLEISFLAEE